MFVLSILRIIRSHLNCGMSRNKLFQSSIKEVVLLSIHKDYVTHTYTHTHTHTHAAHYYNLLPMC